MRDEHDGFAVGRPQFEQYVFHQLPGLNVERRKGLIHQENLRLQNQHLGESDAFFHAAGKLMRVPMSMGSQSNAGKPGGYLHTYRTLVDTAVAQAKRDVVMGRQPWQKSIGLKHVARLPVDTREKLAMHPDVTGGCLEQSGGDIE